MNFVTDIGPPFDLAADIYRQASIEMAKQLDDALYGLLVQAGVPAPIYPPSLRGRLTAVRRGGPDAPEQLFLDGRRFAKMWPIVSRMDGGKIVWTRKYLAG